MFFARVIENWGGQETWKHNLRACWGKNKLNYTPNRGGANVTRQPSNVTKIIPEFSKKCATLSKSRKYISLYVHWGKRKCFFLLFSGTPPRGFCHDPSQTGFGNSQNSKVVEDGF